MDAWLDEELSASAFKDKRIFERFKKITTDLTKSSGKTIPQVCEEWSVAKATYRFLSYDRVEESEILAGQFAMTANRMAVSGDPLLVLHDTTEFAFNRVDPEKIGFTRKGRLPTKTASGLRREYRVCGVLMHASLCITPEGLPLGLTSTRFWTLSVFKNTRQMKRHINPTRIPIEEKESIRWLQNIESSHAVCQIDPSQLIHIGDRESDMYEPFVKCEELGTYYIARACVNRLADETIISEIIAAEERSFKYEICFVNAAGEEIETTLDVKMKPVHLHPLIGKEKKYPNLNVVVIKVSRPKEFHLQSLAEPDVTVSRILGHKDIATTMRYLHVLPNKIADIAATFSVTPRQMTPQISTPPRLAIV